MYTADDARQLVKTAKFPPLGIRGFGSPYAPPVFDVTSTEYLQQANDSLVTIVQIETKEALQNVDEIAKVPGVDVLLIGPFDLGNNIGHPILDGTMHQELKDAIMHIHDAAEKNGKRTGIYCTTGEQSREYADKGFNMVSTTSADSAMAQRADSPNADLNRRRHDSHSHLFCPDPGNCEGQPGAFSSSIRQRWNSEDDRPVRSVT